MLKDTPQKKRSELKRPDRKKPDGGSAKAIKVERKPSTKNRGNIAAFESPRIMGNYPTRTASGSAGNDVKRDDANADAETGTGERIAKRLARAGVASRRDVEKMILLGRVAVNGVVLESPACILQGGEYITVDGKAIAEPENTRLWRCHKPRNVMITHRDPEGRPTLFEIIPKSLPRVVSVGRLDFTSEGLILLTNDGELARGLELPSKGWKRVYRARIYGKIEQSRLDRLVDGIEIDGIKYGAIQAKIDSERGDNCWLTVTLTEGKNREIRKIIEFLGGQVTRLIRVSYGPFQLGLLPPGGVDEIASRQITSLGLSKK